MSNGRACLKAADTLKSGGTALDGVESAIRVLEDDEYLNAGMSKIMHK